MRFVVLTLALLLTGCQSAYYAAAEQVGYHKREILTDRVESAQESQQEAQKQFSSALEQLKTLVDFDGGDLESVYDQVRDEYLASEKAADQVSQRIDAIDHVAGAMFDEWQDELEQYSSASLRRTSEKQLQSTRRQYDKMLRSMRRAEEKMVPVLARLKDNELYLKHNLNARAVTAIGSEFGSLKREIQSLITEMNRAIAESDQFIQTLGQ
ncbi:DUF2959 domain-containing protein [Ferrimonas sediminicola]|uniref:DUF2959 domain-containing protein n=1 Tax=Ferrimonas sediminicola TaxID=2569538 RepID=A0A4U1BBJ1_9GAMM|nr:DUF2959 domain-containing protein [Ferrimonas sediminicola]TKB47964.1 DUF2959 domain-containing protein [Ferrimonas sediminicola]